jgi:hypothetical protein
MRSNNSEDVCVCAMTVLVEKWQLIQEIKNPSPAVTPERIRK